MSASEGRQTLRAEDPILYFLQSFNSAIDRFQYLYSSGLRFFGVRRSLKNWQSGHHASGLKLVPAIGSTSRCPQHSGPSSGGRRQRQDLNFITAAERDELSIAAGVVPPGGDMGSNGSDIRCQFYANANGLF